LSLDSTPSSSFSIITMKIRALVRRIIIPALVLLLLVIGLSLSQSAPEPPGQQAASPAVGAPSPPAPVAEGLPAAPSPSYPSRPGQGSHAVGWPSPAADPESPPPSPAAASAAGVRLRISRLGMDLPIIEGDGVDVPFGKAAHYPGTAQPGEPGNAYLYGHARRGSFLELWSARLGDEVLVEMEDGRQRAYEIAEVHPRVPYNAISFLEPSPDERLTLQTCTTANPADPRFIVIARPREGP